MKNTKHPKNTSTLATTQRSIRGFLTRTRCSGTRSRFDSSRRFC